MININTAPSRAPPKAVTCFVCGRAYGTASIAIHLKQCKTRFLEEEAQKPSRERRPLPPEPSSVDYSDASTFTTKNLEAANDAAFKAYNTAALFPCAHCGRTFLPHALTIHNRSCTADRPAKRPVGPPPAAGGGGGASGGEEEEFALPKRPLHEELASLNDRLEALQAHVCAEVGAITAGVSAVAAHLRRRGTLRA